MGDILKDDRFLKSVYERLKLYFSIIGNIKNISYLS